MLETKLCAQDAYLALHPQSKKPVGVDWPGQGKSKKEALAAKGNLGLLLGSKSGVMDVDLDCLEANGLADLILPQPFTKFIRGSSDSGYYLYKATSFGPTQRFAGNGLKSTLVELRGDGSQTMIQPSIHPNGAKLTYTEINQDASEVDYDELLRSVSFLGACSEVARLWASGLQHELALSFSGLCLKQGIDAQLLVNSVGKPNDEIRGYQGLVDCIGKTAADRVSERIAFYCGQKERSLTVVKEAEAEVINFGRFTDGSNLTEAKLGETFGQWLNGRAVFAFQSKQWMIWNGSIWSSDDSGLMIKLAFHFLSCPLLRF